MASGQATLFVRIKQIGGNILDEIKDRFVITAGDIVNAAAQITRAIVGFVKDSVEAYAEEERAVNTLTQSMMNQGVFTSQLKDKYLEMAAALQKVTTFGDETIVNTIATLQAFAGTKEVTEDLVKATLDLASARGMDADAAANLIGKSLQGQDALKRYGIEVKKSSDEGIRFANVIDGINRKYGDQSIVAAQGLGAIEQAKNKWSDFMETVGRLLTPFILKLADMAKGVSDFLNKLSPAETDPAKMSMEQLTTKIKELQDKMDSFKPTLWQKIMGGTETAKQFLQAEQDMYQAHLDTLIQKEKTAATTRKAIESERLEAKRLKILEQVMIDQEGYAMETAMIGASDEQKLQMQIQALEAQYKAAEGAKEKKKILNDRYELLEKQRTAREIEEEKKKNAELIAHRDKFLGHIATLQDSNNKTLAAIGKAAAIAQITINTAEAASSGSKWGFAIGGPALGAVFAGLAWAAGAAQIAKVQGVQLAQGGIVMPRAGGTMATIGEGGQAEAVIPLDRAGEFGFGGGGVVINFNGPVMGDSEQARTFAIEVDRQLLKLRQSNESVSFDSGII